MEKKGLLAGIDFTEKYCRACWFNEKHGNVETVCEPFGSGKILIPAVLCYDEEEKKWLAGEEAVNFSLNTGAFLYRDLLTNALAQQAHETHGRNLPYSFLLAVFAERLIDLIRRCSGIFTVSFVNITVRRINSEIKEALEEAFERAGVEREKLHILSYPESFAYFIISQDESLWTDGADLFDFSEDGFFLNRLTLSREREKSIIFVNEQNYSLEFSIKDVENIVQRPRLDEKLNDLYDEIKGSAQNTSVYFTGPGFEELWFSNTLKNIAQTRKAFRGSNIYAKGACLAGLLRKEGNLERFTVVCRLKTRAAISLMARYMGEAKTALLSKAAVNWYEAAGGGDFILDGSGKIDFTITSLLSGEKTTISFDLSAFPKRPAKTTRVRISVFYLNEYECEICIKDLGFGSFFPSEGKEIRKILNLEGYI